MADAPKRIKRLLREYAAAAHEEELRRALLPVSEGFKRWERGGPARDLWARYNTPHLEMGRRVRDHDGRAGSQHDSGRVIGASRGGHAVL
jgi:hypothetical protein